MGCVCPGAPGVLAVHGGWGAWVPGAQLSSPKGAGQASRALLSPGDVGGHWLGMRNAGQEDRVPAPLLGSVGGGGPAGSGRVRLKAPGGRCRSPCPACPGLTCFPERVTEEGRRPLLLSSEPPSFNPRLAAEGPLIFLLCSDRGRAGAWGTRRFPGHRPVQHVRWELSPLG